MLLCRYAMLDGRLLRITLHFSPCLRYVTRLPPLLRRIFLHATRSHHAAIIMPCLRYDAYADAMRRLPR